MTDQIMAMDEARFKALAASYGGDLARWPRGSKAAARLLLRQKPDLVGVLAAATEIDQVLDNSSPTPASRDLRKAIRAQTSRVQSPVPRVAPPEMSARARQGTRPLGLTAMADLVSGLLRPGRIWQPASVLAGVFILGWVVGAYQAPPQANATVMEPPQVVEEAVYEATGSIDFEVLR